MSFGQAKQILQYAQNFHKFTSEYFKKLSDSTEQPRMKLLLDYMSRHEKHLERVLKEYESNTKSKALDTWLQFSSECSVFKPVEEISYTDDLTPEKVFEIAAQIDQCMINSYTTVINRTTNPEIRELFENLLKLEEQEKHVRARTALGLLDM